ncbi:uncharacterized protein CLUP02_12360 [Colletotrichum lupini]|uniref:Uncharacterized protein n=1 Tax=Colletotrichum lupini TaxID=145971 RepID=A0A9Q8WKD5_9PEZI|nr:uncharacterized protein CLUP02_12360 [Colletotrichum lupini]UQC86858.1 hypothetical protein CLUP02_12360 [Colletotrichum lupini]
MGERPANTPERKPVILAPRHRLDLPPLELLLSPAGEPGVTVKAFVDIPTLRFHTRLRNDQSAIRPTPHTTTPNSSSDLPVPCPCQLPARRLPKLDDRINRNLGESWWFQVLSDRYPTGKVSLDRSTSKPCSPYGGEAREEGCVSIPQSLYIHRHSLDIRNTKARVDVGNKVADERQKWVIDALLPHLQPAHKVDELDPQIADGSGCVSPRLMSVEHRLLFGWVEGFLAFSAGRVFDGVASAHACHLSSAADNILENSKSHHREVTIVKAREYPHPAPMPENNLGLVLLLPIYFHRNGCYRSIATSHLMNGGDGKEDCLISVDGVSRRGYFLKLSLLPRFWQNFQHSETTSNGDLSAHLNSVHLLNREVATLYSVVKLGWRRSYQNTLTACFPSMTILLEGPEGVLDTFEIPGRRLTDVPHVILAGRSADICRPPHARPEDVSARLSHSDVRQPASDITNDGLSSQRHRPVTSALLRWRRMFLAVISP